MITNTKKLHKVYAKQQKGLVLFIALIALVAMSLAAAALIRSVDTSVLVAGNLAFKQSAVMSGDASIVPASNYVITHSLTLGTIAETSGYYPSTTNDTSAANYLDLRAAATWTNAKSKLATGVAGFDANGTDTSGNTVRYVIQRMCRTNVVPATTADCLFGVSSVDGSSKQVCKNTGCGPTSSATSPMYRITSRVNGPKDTVSYIQAYVY
jgi:type IV pilus assembly protein PilX